MNPLLLLGLVGLGGVVLYATSSTAHAATAAPGTAPLPAAPGASSSSSSNLPVVQVPQPGYGGNPYNAQQPPQSGGVVYDPNLGGSGQVVPAPGASTDWSGLGSSLQSLEQSFGLGGSDGSTTAGVMDGEPFYNPFTKQYYW